MAVVVQVSHLSSPLSKLKNGTTSCVSFKELQNVSQKPPPPASPTSPWPKGLLPKPVTVRERNILHWFSVINHPHLGLGMEPAFPKAHGSLAKGWILEKKLRVFWKRVSGDCYWTGNQSFLLQQTARWISMAESILKWVVFMGEPQGLFVLPRFPGVK